MAPEEVIVGEGKVLRIVIVAVAPSVKERTLRSVVKSQVPLVRLKALFVTESEQGAAEMKVVRKRKKRGKDRMQ